MEVESFYSSNGYLLPQYHQFYWMGLRMVIPVPALGFHCVAGPARPRICAAAPSWSPVG
jgi:hypothetical protein